MQDIREIALDAQSGMEDRRSNWEHLWKTVAKVVLPRMDSFDGDETPGSQRNQRQYDAFPAKALDRFAAVMEAGLMPRTNVWHRLSTGDTDLDSQSGVAEYMEDHNRLMWQTRYAPRANFSGQAHEVRLSLGAFGTGAMLVEPAPWGGIRYASIHLSEVFVSTNFWGEVDTVHRKFKIKARNALKMFGKDTPSKIVEAVEAGKGGKEFEFLHCVHPREDYDRNKIGPEGMPWRGVYIELGQKQIVRDEGYYEMPYIVSRYTTGAGEDYGRGPAITNLPDIMMLQEMRRTTIEAANMAVDVPRLMAADLLSEFDFRAGSNNYGALDENGNELVKPWNSGSRPDIGLDMMQDTRSQIDDGFLGVYFRVLLDNPNMTATQAMLIAQQQGQMTAPAVGRLQTEWLSPLLRRESGILYRQGKLPEMPQRLREHLEETKRPLEIEYISPLTLASRSEEAVSILRAFESMAPIAQIDPTIYRRFDIDGVADVIAEVNGVPAKAIKSKEDLESEKQAEQAANTAQQVLQAAPIAAETAKTIAETQNMSQNNPALVG
jgi:hypothetical protein